MLKKLFKNIMSSISINNVYHQGKSITVINNKVFIDGKDVTPDTKEINITVEGDINSLSVDACNEVKVNGSCNTVKTASGDVVCVNVSGDVTTMSGDVECQDVMGNITTMSGDVRCNNVTGNVESTTGDIKYRGDVRN